jgi:hypothetical protein
MSPLSKSVSTALKKYIVRWYPSQTLVSNKTLAVLIFFINKNNQWDSLSG